MRRRSKALISFSACVAAVLAAELWARSLDRRKTPMLQEGSQAMQPSADPRMRFEPKPGATQVTHYRKPGGELRRTISIVINSQGFRGPEVEREKPAGTIRIVTVGDSQTYGIGVAEEETWSAVLQRSLAGAVSGRRVEVMNCGVAGYDTEQEVAALETRWLDYRPDLVILGFFANDTAMQNLDSEPGVGRSSALLKFFSPGRPGFFRWVRQRSSLVDHLSDGVYHKLLIQEWERGTDALYEDDFEGFVRARAALARGRDLVGARGARFAVVCMPFLVRSGEGLMSSHAYRKVGEFCRDEGIECLDLEPLFEDRDLAAMRVHERDWHSGAEAHRLEGEAISAWLRERGLLPLPSVR